MVSLGAFGEAWSEALRSCVRDAFGRRSPRRTVGAVCAVRLP